MDRALLILDYGSWILDSEVRFGLEALRKTSWKECKDPKSNIEDRAGRRTDRAARRTDGDHGVEVSIRLCESRGMGANPIGPPIFSRRSQV
jgi:hypothetical protein